MTNLMNRRDLLKLTGIGVAVFVSGTTVRASGSRQKKNESYKGLGFRNVEADVARARYEIEELPIVKG